MIPLIDIIKTKGTLIAAHRGASGKYKENTLKAFNSAIEAGADMIELDVQFTKDEQIIVYHNDIYESTGVSISSVDYAYIAKYEEQNNVDVIGRITLLTDILKEISGKVYLIIEIKPFFSQTTKNNLDNLLQLLLDNNYEQFVVLAAYDINNLIYIKSQNSNIHTSSIYTAKSGLFPIDYKNQCQCDAIICEINELNKQIADNAHNCGLYIGVYGAETQEHIDKCNALNVRVIGTDYPDKDIR